MSLYLLIHFYQLRVRVGPESIAIHLYQSHRGNDYVAGVATQVALPTYYIIPNIQHNSRKEKHKTIKHTHGNSIGSIEKKTVHIKGKCESQHPSGPDARGCDYRDTRTGYANHECAPSTYHPSAAGTPRIATVNNMAYIMGSIHEPRATQDRHKHRDITVVHRPIVSANQPSVASCSCIHTLS